MNKVDNYYTAMTIMELLGIKDVTKPWQKKKGTQVFELPFKTMYANGYKETNRFSIYKSGYVRKMVVNNNGASYSCYQLNKVRKKEYFVKDYEFIGDTYDTRWTGKYCKQHGRERIMIPNYEDRLVYLCNYILKNYYRNQTGASFYRINDYQVSLMQNTKPEPQHLPFEETVERDSFIDNNEITVIINGHRYNLS